MLKNYFKIAFRLLLRNKTFSIINIVGLAVGLCSSMIIYLYVSHQLSYDKLHDDADSIYRFIMQEEDNGKMLVHPYTRLPLAPALIQDFPEIDIAVRARRGEQDLAFNEKVFANTNLLYVDSDFLELFNFPVVNGSKENALLDKSSVVLTETKAIAIFGENDPIGRTIRTLSGHQFIVTAIVEDPPPNTMFQFEALMTVDFFENSWHYNFSWVSGPEFNTFIKLKENQSENVVNEKLKPFFSTYVTEEVLDGYLQPIGDIHLHSSGFDFTDGAKRYSEIVLFALIAVFILIIAIINYINLSTARSMERAKEVGIKKIVGANRALLIRQFFAESYLLVFFSIFLALIFVEVFLPYVNLVLQEQLSLYQEDLWKIATIIISFFLIVGGLSAVYPAMYLSSFNPSKVLKGGLSSKAKTKLRTTLVVFQFLIASVLISVTLYSIRQMSFIMNKDKGYNEDNMIAVVLNSAQLRDNYEVIKGELMKLPGVVNAAASSNYPGYGFTANGYTPEGYNDPILIKLLKTDENYFETMEMEIVQGRSFSENLKADEFKFVINETLARQLGWKNAVGKTIKRNDNKYTVIGVVKDFHFNTLQKEIEPLILSVRTSKYFNYFVMNIRLSGINNSVTLNQIEKILKRTDQSQVFDYVFLNNLKNDIYSFERSFSKIFQLFSILAICIACLGLYGLAAYTAEQRIKEIGIRKALGASSVQLMKALSAQYLYILVLANAIALPIVIYAINSWQSNYAYFVQLRIVDFAISFLISMIIAASIVFVISRKVIDRNPVEALKYE